MITATTAKATTRNVLVPRSTGANLRTPPTMTKTVMNNRPFLIGLGTLPSMPPAATSCFNIFRSSCIIALSGLLVPGHFVNGMIQAVRGLLIHNEVGDQDGHREAQKDHAYQRHSCAGWLD